MSTMFEEFRTARYQECFSPFKLPILFIFGIFYNILNAYWFIKIVKNLCRKILGIEMVKANNELDEPETNGKKKKN